MNSIVARPFLLVAVAVAVMVLCAAAALAVDCKRDLDCVPVSCCHSGFCVPKTKAPTCKKDTVCSTGCQPFTTDCGGHCVCDRAMGKCEAVFGSGNFSAIHQKMKLKKHVVVRGKFGKRH